MGKPFSVSQRPRPAEPARRPAVRAVIPFLEPELPPLESLWDDFQKIYRSKTFSNGGPFERELTAAMAAYLGVKHVVAVGNATLGLMLAIKALARPGRTHVVLPSFTFAATALAVEWCGLTPLFCDVDPEGWQATATLAELAPRDESIALLLPCNTFGAPLDLPQWRALAQALDVPLLVDSAPGLGATYPDGCKQGGAGVAEVFSMHATKPFAIGEGGLVTTDDEALAATLRRMRNFGFDDARICAGPGMNAKVPELQAAIACRVLESLPRIVSHRRARAALYRRRLGPLGLSFQRDGECSAYQFMPVRLPEGVDAAAVREALAAEGIETRAYFSPPLHAQPHFLGRAALGPLAQTERLGRSMLSLPMSNRITEEAVERVCQTVAHALP